MCIIKDKERVSLQIKLGVAEAERLGTTLNELADHLGVADGTLKSWTYSSMPGAIEDSKLFGLIWLIMRFTTRKEQWVEDLLTATSVPVFTPITPHLMRAYFFEAIIDGSPIPQDEIDSVLISIYDPNSYTKNRLGEEGHLPGSHFLLQDQH